MLIKDLTLYLRPLNALGVLLAQPEGKLCCLPQCLPLTSGQSLCTEHTNPILSLVHLTNIIEQLLHSGITLEMMKTVSAPCSVEETVKDDTVNVISAGVDAKCIDRRELLHY